MPNLLTDQSFNVPFTLIRLFRSIETPEESRRSPGTFTHPFP
jgi:hypothetical protein